MRYVGYNHRSLCLVAWTMREKREKMVVVILSDVGNRKRILLSFLFELRKRNSESIREFVLIFLAFSL